MRSDERELIQSILAPLAGLPETMAALSRTMSDLPGALRALAEPPPDRIEKVPSVQDGPTLVPAGHTIAVGERVAVTVARLAGVDPVPDESFEDAMTRALATHAQAGAAEACRRIICDLGAVSGDPMSDKQTVRQAIDWYAGRKADEVRSQIAQAVGLTDVPTDDAGLADALLGEGARRLACKVLGVDAIQGGTPAQAIDNELRAALEQGRAESLASLAWSQGLDVPDGASARDVLIQALTDAREADVSLRDVRERAAKLALLAVLDELAPGARHERSGTGKVEDMSAAELRVELVRRQRDYVTVEVARAQQMTGGQDADAQALADLQETLDVGKDALRHALAAMEVQHQETDVLRLIGLLAGAARKSRQDMSGVRDALATVERALVAALADDGIDHEGSTLVSLVELLAQSRLMHANNASAAAEIARTAQETIATLEQQVSGGDKDLDALATALDTIATLDRTLRSAVTAAGVSVDDATVLEVAERLVLVASNTEAKNVSNRTACLREYISLARALGLRDELGNMSVAAARTELIAGVDALLKTERAEGFAEGEISAGPQPDAPELHADVTGTTATLVKLIVALGGEDDPVRAMDLTDACDVLVSRVDAVTYWAKTWLPTAQLWDATITADCPLAFEPLDRIKPELGSGDDVLRRIHEDDGDWRDLARVLRSVAEGDEAEPLARWLVKGKDARALLGAALDVEASEQVRAGGDDVYVEALARSLYEHLPLGVDIDAVNRVAIELASAAVPDSWVAPVSDELARFLGAASGPRDLDAWCALPPGDRNRFVDRTRDALARAAG